MEALFSSVNGLLYRTGHLVLSAWKAQVPFFLLALCEQTASSGAEKKWKMCLSQHGWIQWEVYDERHRQIVALSQEGGRWTTVEWIITTEQEHNKVPWGWCIIIENMVGVYCIPPREEKPVHKMLLTVILFSQIYRKRSSVQKVECRVIGLVVIQLLCITHAAFDELFTRLLLYKLMFLVAVYSINTFTPFTHPFDDVWGDVLCLLIAGF